MRKYDENETIKQYDTSVIRPEVKESDIQIRGKGLDKKQLKTIKDALITFHNLEVMATNIYRYQVRKANSDVLNQQLICAMLNEHTHIQDFQVKLLEYGFRPSWKHYFYSMLGMIIGTISGWMGEKAIKSTCIWVETKAVAHYKELLETVEWDDQTRAIIEKDWVDEYHHIDVCSK